MKKEGAGRKRGAGAAQSENPVVFLPAAMRESPDNDALRWYHALFEESKDAIGLFGMGERIVNQAWLDLFGYTRGEMNTVDLDSLYANTEERRNYLHEMETAGFVRDYAIKMARKDGTVIECVCTAITHRNQNGKTQYYQSILRDVGAYSATLAALRESEENYRRLVENINEVIYSVDTKGIITYISPVVERICGYRSTELLGKPLADVRYIFPMDLPAVREVFGMALEGESSVHIFRFLSKRGDIVWFNASVYPDVKAGVVTGFHGILSDITASIESETDLRESRERLSAFLDSATESFFLFDSSLRLVEINRTARKEFSLTREHIMGESLPVFLKSIAFPVNPAIFVEVLNSGVPQHVKDISFGDFFMDFRVFRVGNGIGVIATNITERKRSEHALRHIQGELERRVKERTADLHSLNRSLEREIAERNRAQVNLSRRESELNAILNNLVDIAWLKDQESRYILVNRAFAEQHGKAPDFFTGLTDYNIWTAKRAELYQAGDRMVMDAGKTLKFEEPLEPPGKSFLLETIKSPIRDESGRIVGTVGNARDITERKTMENALRMSEERLNLAMEGSEEGIWDWNIKEGTIFWSPRIPMMLGFSPAEFEGVPNDIFSRIHTDDRENVCAAVRNHLAGNTPSLLIEYRVRNKAGEWRWVQNTGRITAWDEKKQPLRMIGTHRDVTERKRTEDILRENEERYRTIFENAGVALLEIDLSHVKVKISALRASGIDDFRAYILANPEFCRDSYSLMRIVNMNGKALDLYEAESKDALLAVIHNQFSPYLVPFISRLLTAIAENRTSIQLEFEADTIKGTRRFVMVNATIPSRDDRFNRVLISVTDLTERKQFEDALRRAHDDLEARVRERTAVLARTNRDLEWEIQERQAIETALRESEDRYRTLFETSMDAVAVSTSDLRFNGVNQAWIELFGYTEDEIAGRNFEMVFAGADIFEKFREIFAATGYVRDYEARFRKKDGTVMDCLLTMTAWENSAGAEIGFQILIHDITERKKAERVITFQANLKELISGISTSFINVPADEIDAGITRAIAALGAFFHVDRGYLCCIDAAGALVVTHTWCAAGVSSRMKGEVFPVVALPWMHERLASFEIVSFPAVSEMPAEASTDRNTIAAWGIGAFVCVPMVGEGGGSGMFGLESLSMRMEWDEESKPLLKLVGEMFVNALERRRIGGKILEYQEKLRSIASELTLAEERERRRIAVDLHDRIGQTLAVSKIKLASIRERMGFPPLTEEIGEVTELIGNAIKDTRSLIFEISPPVLYDLGLEAALEWLTEQIELQHGVETVFLDDGGEKGLDANMSVLLFQFTRELMVNAVKHARARKISLAIRRAGQTVELEVADDGIGFDVDSSSVRPSGEAGYGLFSIRERLDHLGGHLRIDSIAGRGTRITMSVPVKSFVQGGWE